MLHWFLENRIRATERELGVHLDYARYLVRHSLSATWRMARFVRLTKFSSPVPTDAMAVAGIAGSMADDCGECVQIAVHLARQQGVAPEIIQAVLNRDPQLLSEPLRDVYHFTEAATSLYGPDEPLRERLRSRWGDRGLIDLAMAVALHRVYPTFKRGLGYAQSCSQVTVTA